MTSNERFNRIGAAIERLAGEGRETRLAIRELAEESRAADARLAARIEQLADENTRFHLAVRGAIEGLHEDVRSLAKSAAKHDKAIAALEKQFQAYLVSRPPQ